MQSSLPPDAEEGAQAALYTPPTVEFLDLEAFLEFVSPQKRKLPQGNGILQALY